MKFDSSTLTELKTFPNQAVVQEIIEEGKTGGVFSLSENSILLLENCKEDPFAFIAGNLTNEALEKAISILSRARYPMVYCNPQYHPLFLKKGWNFHLRVQFTLKHFSEKDFHLEQQNQVKLIEELELFKSCTWYKEKSELYLSDEDFLKYGMGYALCNDEQILSETYATIGGGYAELGVITQPDYRKRGYAIQICNFIIKKCKELGIIPIWSCNVDNIASFNTALKLGFKPDFYYVVMVPNFGNVYCAQLKNWIKNNDNI